MTSAPKQPSWFQKNNITANPPIVKLDREGRDAFFVDHYTGRTITSRVGIPAFLCSSSSAGKSDSCETVLHGAWANWNIMLREIYDANALGEISDELLLGIQSWVAEYASIEGEFELAPPASELQRFGGPLSDSSWDGRFVANANKALSVQSDMAARAARQAERKASQKEKPPSLTETIRCLTVADCVTVFDVAVFPANRGQYWVHRRAFDQTNEFEQRVAQDLGVTHLPGQHTATSVVISPDCNTKKANKILGKDLPPAPVAAPTPPPPKPAPIKVSLAPLPIPKDQKAKDALPMANKKRSASVSWSQHGTEKVPEDLYKLPQKKPVRRTTKAPPPSPVADLDLFPWPTDIDSQAD